MSPIVTSPAAPIAQPAPLPKYEIDASVVVPIGVPILVRFPPFWVTGVTSIVSPPDELTEKLYTSELVILPGKLRVMLLAVSGADIIVHSIALKGLS